MKIQQLATAFALGLTTALAQAAPVEVNTGNITISFDDEAAYAEEILTYSSGFPYQSTTLPAYAGVDNSLVLSPWLSSDVGGSGYADGGYINFNLHDINFTAQSGYAITGYRVIFSGEVDRVGDGWYDIGGTSGWAEVSGTNYTFTSALISDFPTTGFTGWINLDAPYVPNEDGTASVYGTARGSITNIRIEAQVVAIPEPETYALLGMGLLGVAVASRRKKL